MENQMAQSAEVSQLLYKSLKRQKSIPKVKVKQPIEMTYRETNSSPDIETKQGPCTNDDWLDYVNIKETIIVLRAVNNKLRQKLISLLKENPAMTVTDIYIKMRLEQSVASQHLCILRKSGIVATKRKGKFVYYSLNNNRLHQISELTADIVNYK